jgi:UDP-2,3-diacylglucosamine pyrophosphatase LpxH
MEPTLAVISDLHIGRNDDFDIFHNDGKEDLFRAFLAYLKQRPSPVELVIDGDLVDFLQLRPWKKWNRETALDKIREIVARSAAVFRSLGGLLQNPTHRITVLLGNHDVELAYPEVGKVLRDAILDGTRGAEDRLILIDRRITYHHQVNGVYVHIEHGNEHDSWNAIEYAPLFHDAEVGTSDFAYPPGTQLVYETMNLFKETYRFVDILKPEIPSVLLVLLALRPWQCGLAVPEAMRLWLLSLGNGLRGAIRRLIAGPQLGTGKDPAMIARHRLESEMAIAVCHGDALHSVSLAAIAEDLERFLTTVPEVKTPVEATLALRDDMALRLATSALQTLHRFGAVELGPSALLPAARPSDPLVRSAKSKLRGNVKLVVFGHTHEALVAESAEGVYVNSGAWANLVRLPTSPKRKEVLAWLEQIAENRFELTASPTYVLVEPDGDCAKVSLNLWTEKGGQSLWTKRI